MSDVLDFLSPLQRDLLEEWLPGLRVLRDHSWGLVDNVVLEVECRAERFIVKADGETNHHLLRELDAHEHWLAPWVSTGRAPRLVASDRDARILVTEYLPGDLVLGSPVQQAPDTFRQAGELLAQLHDQPGRVDPDYEASENATMLGNLAKPHRIRPEVAGRLSEIVRSWLPEPVLVVPTHGDWQPRNWLAHHGRVSVIDFGRAGLRPALTDWLAHHGRVSVIDFGRAGLRPALTDWLRLEARDFRDDPTREAAFVEGYGADPRASAAWFRERLREAVNTAVWAFSVGDGEYEFQGHAMVERVLAEA